MSDRLTDNGISLLETDKTQGLLFIKQDEMYSFAFYASFRQLDKIQATTRIKISNIWKFEDTALEMVTTHVCVTDNKETATNCCFVRRLNLNDFS